MPDSLYLKWQYKAVTGKKLNLKNPCTFNEKLQWLKLHDRNPLYTTLVDKYEVKKYVAERIGEQYIIPTIGVWDNFDDIDFAALPEQFVLKCTHDSGSVVICKDKSSFDVEYARQRLELALEKNYYWLFREWPYKNVKPRIIAEKYLSEFDNDSADDYKVMCFDGEPKVIQVHKNRFKNHTQDFFDLNWKKLDISQEFPCSDIKIEKPAQYEDMIKFSRLLANKIPQVRIDWYNVKCNLYFGELTFFDGAGLEEFVPDSWNRFFGDLIKLRKFGGGGKKITFNSCVFFAYFEDDDGIKDYKFQCFEGKVDNILVCSKRNANFGVKYNYFSRDWKPLAYSIPEKNGNVDDCKSPVNLDLMLKLAEYLSIGLKEVRVDFYEVRGKIYFGEFTFYSNAGIDNTITEQADIELGKKLILL